MIDMATAHVILQHLQYLLLPLPVPLSAELPKRTVLVNCTAAGMSLGMLAAKMMPLQHTPTLPDQEHVANASQGGQVVPGKHV